MLFRVKTVGSNSYVQVVQSYRDEGRPRQRVLLTLGSLEELRSSGHLYSLLASGSRLSETMLILTEHQRGELESTPPRRFESVVVFERLWRQTGCREVIEKSKRPTKPVLLPVILMPEARRSGGDRGQARGEAAGDGVGSRAIS